MRRIDHVSEGSVTEVQVFYSAGSLSASYRIGRIAAANEATTYPLLIASSSQVSLSAVSMGSKSDESRLMASHDLGIATINVGTYRQKVDTGGADKVWYLTDTIPMNALAHAS